jgi:membrane protease YdiL (CAAX protease family)
MSELTYESKLSPLALFALTFIVAGLGFVLIGPIIGFFLAIPFFEGSITDQLPKMTDPMSYPEFRLPLYIMQGSATLIGLALLPSLFWYSIERKGITSWFAGKKVYGLMLITTLVMTIAFMAANTVFIDWNAHLQFPASMKGFEDWARSYEDRAEDLTKFMTQFSSTGEFLFAFLVIAILPAFGEELVFRGLLQPQLFRATKNIHVAIWASAILFSAFHLQFFGFIPRMLLGALFGYLYYWSGSLLMPMFAHFVNNGFSVLMLYLNQKGIVEMDVESTDAAPWPVVLIFALIAGAMLFYFKNFFDKKREQPDGQ